MVCNDDLPTLKAKVASCTSCSLCAGRNQTVFGAGNINANVMCIGEAPGANEDVIGIPFVGKAGNLLNKMLECILLNRNEVYITNIVKCRPPENRKPTPTEAAMCAPYLWRQIQIIKPKIILSFGATALESLLPLHIGKISQVHGKVFIYNEHGINGGKYKCNLIPIYHPAYLLRNPAAKSSAWEDLKVARILLDELTGGNSGKATDMPVEDTRIVPDDGYLTF